MSTRYNWVLLYSLQVGPKLGVGAVAAWQKYGVLEESREGRVFSAFLPNRLGQIGSLPQPRFTVFLKAADCSGLSSPQGWGWKAQVTEHWPDLVAFQCLPFAINLFVNKIFYIKSAMCLLWDPDWCIGCLCVYQYVIITVLLLSNYFSTFYSIMS